MSSCWPVSAEGVERGTGIWMAGGIETALTLTLTRVNLDRSAYLSKSRGLSVRKPLSRFTQMSLNVSQFHFFHSPPPNKQNRGSLT